MFIESDFIMQKTSELEEVYEVLGRDGCEAAVRVVGCARVSRVLRQTPRE